MGSWLGDHARAKPGTPMPDVMHGLDPGARLGAVEDLTHFLASVQPPGPPGFLGADKARVEIGKERYHALGCVACHAPMERPDGVPDDVWKKAKENGAPLGKLAEKYPGGELVRFLLNPVKHRPGGRMPSQNLTDTEAIVIATYLLAGQVPGLTDGKLPLRTIPGVRWDYFEGHFGKTAELDGAKPMASGETGDLVTTMAKRGEQFALKFTGVITAPTEGDYTFWLTSDDGSTLDLDGARVVDNDGEHAPQEKTGKVKLKAGPHSFDLRFFQNGAGFELKAGWSGPGFTRQPIGAAALEHYGQPMVPLGHQEFAVEAVKAASGRAWFEKLNCAACHALDDGLAPVATGRKAQPLATLAQRTANGCLADTVPAASPRYDLTDTQRAALRQTLSAADQLSRPITPAQEVSRSLARFNCYCCHARDGFGGPALTGKDAWFKVVGEADLGEEGKLPPHLNGVGAKLRSKWLSTLLNEGSKVRPYMAVRMPVFGAANVGHLPALLAAADRKTPLPPEPVVTGRDPKFGRKLVGRDGLSCVACHTFSTLGSMGIPALGLDHMYERLEWDWFRRYLPDPAALRPGTRMPSFWPEGHAVNTEILDGGTDAQIQAIWAWMAGGAKADIPAGLVRARQEILVEKEPVIYRNFIDGAGSRAIGVGYPERANIAFDANQMRLAMIWQGSFIDRSRHSTDRGVGYEPPLGDHLVRLPEGQPFAVLPAPDAPWPAAQTRSPGYKFLGYDLDGSRRPAFRYEFEGTAVTDRIVPKAVDVDITLVRTLTFSGVPATGTLWFRAATGDIQVEKDGFLVGGSVHYRFRGAKAVIVGRELRVPIRAPGELVEEINW